MGPRFTRWGQAKRGGPLQSTKRCTHAPLLPVFFSNMSTLGGAIQTGTPHRDFVHHQTTACRHEQRSNATKTSKVEPKGSSWISQRSQGCDQLTVPKRARSTIDRFQNKPTRANAPYTLGTDDTLLPTPSPIRVETPSPSPPPTAGKSEVVEAV